MYLSNINPKEDKLQKVQVCKKGNLQKCKSTSYLQSTLRVRNRQSPWQICSGCLPRWLCCGSYTLRVFKGCLVLPEMWRRDHLWNHWQTKKVGYWRHGSGGSMRLHFLMGAKKLLVLLLWRLQTVRTSCLPFNSLSSKPQQSQKISQNATWHSDVHFLK